MPLPSLSSRAGAFFGGFAGATVASGVPCAAVVRCGLPPPPPPATTAATRASSPIECSLIASRAAAGALGGAGLRRHRVRVHDHRVDHRDHLIRRHPGPLSLLAHLLRARALIDADRPELPIGLLDHIGANPANIVRHLLTHLRGTRSGLLQRLGGLPEITTANGIEIHASDFRHPPRPRQSGTHPELRAAPGHSRSATSPPETARRDS